MRISRRRQREVRISRVRQIRSPHAFTEVRHAVKSGVVPYHRHAAQRERRRRGVNGGVNGGILPPGRRRRRLWQAMVVEPSFIKRLAALK